MRIRRYSRGGFTLVEMAVVICLIGIVLTAVMRGHQLLETAKSQVLVEDTIKIMEMLYTFYGRYGRLPGDVDRDGFIDWERNSVSNSVSAWDELVLSRVAKDRLETLTQNQFGGLQCIASIRDSKGNMYNAVIYRNVPCSAAELMDRFFDGTINAGKGAVRRIEGIWMEEKTTEWIGCNDTRKRVDVVFLINGF